MFVCLSLCLCLCVCVFPMLLLLLYVFPQADLKSSLQLPIVDGGPVDAFCGYFDVTFAGSEQNPAGKSLGLYLC